MPVTINNDVTNTLGRLLKKVASAKGDLNLPPTSHTTGKLDGGNSTPPSGVTATEQKPKVKETVQGSSIDGSKLTDGKKEPEAALNIMESGEKAQVTPEIANDDPNKKMSSLSMTDLLAKHAAVATPLAASLLVKAAKSTETPAETITPTVTPAVGQAAATPAQADVAKAAKAGAEAAEAAAQQFVVQTISEAEEAADLLAHFTKLSVETQRKIAAEAEEARKKADASVAPMLPTGGSDGGAPPMPGGAAPAGDAMPAPAGPGGDAAMADAGAGVPPGLGGAGSDPATEKQLEQLLLALLEQHGSADPKPLEDASDPGTKEIGKQARAFLKSGKFQVRTAKDAKDRAQIDQMKQFIRETVR